jgi:Fe-S cluster assembly protein SufD
LAARFPPKGQVSSLAFDLSPWAGRIPSTDEEIWRYSRIGELNLVSYSSGAAITDASVDLAEDPAANGMVMTEPTDVFSEINHALGQTLVLRVPAGRCIAEPIVITHTVTAAGGLVAPRLIIDAGADSEVTVVERFVSADIDALVLPVLELKAGPAARVKYLTINELGPRVWSIGSQVASGDRDSTTVLANVALGGYYARMRTDARLIGKGASGDQIAVYFGDGNQMHDFRTLQEHQAPNTTSNLLFKGAVQGTSSSVYTGMIRIDHEAPRSRAFQTNRTIKLSEGSWAESVPNLDILNNDVQCSHASAVGPIDADQRFYLESRGIPPSVAERLIVTGFFDEVFERLPVMALVPELRSAVAAKLEATHPPEQDAA